ncbi:MAG TPA: thioredoxin-disulfide reductase [Bdellovibrionales bacterium]|nr:thioredoxin-disulfide reductase [Bdellovibrionales bacterium]
MAVEKVIIIGSGPAGLTAALYTSRALLKPLMFEGEMPGGLLTTTTDVENYPGFPEGIMGPELMENMRKQAERFGTRFITQNVTKVDFKSRPFKVWVGDKLYESSTVIVSTGASSKMLGIPSEQTYWAKGVSTCATCDGAFFKNVPVAVIGGGDSAMEEANFLTRFASRVFIIHRRDSFRASKIMADRALKNPKVEPVWNSTVDEIFGDGKLVKGIRVKDVNTGATREIALEGVFVAIGHQPNSQLFKGQLDMTDVGYIKTKPHSSYTSVDGVFACGDLQDHVYRQAITAAGSGCMAAIDAERWLEAHGQ